MRWNQVHFVTRRTEEASRRTRLASQLAVQWGDEWPTGLVDKDRVTSESDQFATRLH